MIIDTQLHLIRYDGVKLKEGAVTPVRNNKEPISKAEGGLWTSTFDPIYGSEWLEYCRDIEIYKPNDNKWHGYLLTPSKDANILVIDSFEDLSKAYGKYKLESDDPFVAILALLNFEKIAEDYDAMHLTNKGQMETRFTRPMLYGWDVECTHWFRWKFTNAEEITWEQPKSEGEKFK